MDEPRDSRAITATGDRELIATGAERESGSALTQDELAFYLSRMDEIEKQMPDRADFLRLAQDSPPPQEWFDDAFDPGR